MNTEVNHLSKEHSPNKSSWLAVSWVLGILLGIGSIGMLFSHFLAGIVLILASLVVLPVSYEYIKHKYNFPSSRGVRIGTVLILMVIAGTFLPKPAPAPQAPENEVAVAKEEAKAATQKVNNQSATDAQKELDSIMLMGKKAGLVMSYEFSDRSVVVLVDKGWYGQNVQFKKDFIAKVGILKKAITGYSHFEVRDGYSNEKVAELTSFSQSIEIYK